MTRPAQAAVADRRRILAIVALVAVAVAAVAPVADAAKPKTKRVSITSSEAERVDDSLFPSVSADGRFVAFESTAALAPGHNGNRHIYLRDRRKGKTKRLSISSSGAIGNGFSSGASISANGRWVAFASSATNLVGSDTNAVQDVFVRDRKSGKTKRVSVKTGGGQVSSSSRDPAISANGRYVAFESVAAFVSGDTNGQFDVYLHDRKTKKTRRVSVSSGGGQGAHDAYNPSVSRDGRFVVFDTRSAFAGKDTNDKADIYVRDRRRKKTKLISQSTSGAIGDEFSELATITPNGRYVVFESEAENLVGNDDNVATDIFIRDRRKGRTRRVSLTKLGQADGSSFGGVVSGNGRYVAFESKTKLTVKDTNGAFDVYLRDRQKGRTKLLSIDRFGSAANGGSFGAAMSTDGRVVAFRSDATDLIKNDGNASADVFTRAPLH